MVDELHDVKPAKGFDQVYYPGEIQEEVKTICRARYSSSARNL